MKRILCTLFLAAAFLSVPHTASAQLIKWGVKAGLNLTNPSTKSLDAGLKGETGWFLGPMAEITIPIVGLGVDGSLLYSQANNKLEGEGFSETVKLHYIDIPLNLKYSIGLGSLASVFIAAGPQFSFNVSGNSVSDVIYELENEPGEETTSKGDNKTFQASLNLGVGVKLIRKLQIYGGYNFALGNSFTVEHALESIGQTVTGKAKNNMWKVSVAYMF